MHHRSMSRRRWLRTALATLGVMAAENVPAHLARVGARLLAGFRDVADRHPRVVREVAGLPEMCCLQFHDEAAGAALAVAAARRGLLFKRSAYNFVSLAHDDAARDLGRLAGPTPARFRSG